MLRFLLLAGLLLGATPVQAEPSITGLWLTQDHDGVIAVSRCGVALCGRIVGFFLDRPADPTPRDYRGASQCNLPLFTDARPIAANLWKGHIVDPRNGSVYGVELRLDRHGNLALRGFLGIPLLGRTQTWTRFKGTVPQDCRIVGPGTISAMNGSPAVNGSPRWGRLTALFNPTMARK
ncbi:MAG: hypothetical protein B7Z80_15415 [Rhodospirillales bacterium 20-64-7]|nr:MAG: hypothetical protein B7Z80_15415 [Rhodospirillales bacterium 20-64-7]HQT78043.1 DUF2147 domain-containing protein [Rhodopila sp.]